MTGLAGAAAAGSPADAIPHIITDTKMAVVNNPFNFANGLV
jgi:hypothetical protein